MTLIPDYALPSLTMSFEFTIQDDSPLAAVRGWRPDDVMRFCMRVAKGVNKPALATLSEVSEEVVEELLGKQQVREIVDEFEDLLTCSSEEFCRKLQVMVRSAMLAELQREDPAPVLLFYWHFCIKIADRGPVEETIKALLKSLRRKRRQAALPSPVSPPEPQAPPAVEPATCDELCAEGGRAAVGNVVGESQTATAAAAGEPDEVERMLLLAIRLVDEDRIEEAHEILEILQKRGIERQPQGP